MKILVRDMVQVITGKDKGKQGEVISVLSDKNKVVVKGINLITKHMKPREGQPGKKIQKEAPLHVSNVMILDEKTKTPTKVSYVLSKNGKKERVARKTGALLKNTGFKK